MKEEEKMEEMPIQEEMKEDEKCKVDEIEQLINKGKRKLMDSKRTQ